MEMWVNRSASPWRPDRGNRVATADDDRRAGVGAGREEARDGPGAVGEPGISKTPSGPFQNTVWVFVRAASMRSNVVRPTSTMCHEAGIFSAGIVVLGAA